MDKLQADKLTEIKANAELLQEEGYKSGLLDDVLYLLQLVETMKTENERLNNEMDGMLIMLEDKEVQHG